MKHTRYNWTNEELAAEAARFSTRLEFKVGSRKAYQTASKRGLMDDICTHMERLTRKLSDTDLSDIAARFDTKNDFRKFDGAAYGTALTRGILDQICHHMRPLRHRWTEQELADLAAKFTTRSSFKYANSSAYSLARKRGILDRICRHMPIQDKLTAADAIYVVCEGKPNEVDSVLVKIGLSSANLVQSRVATHFSLFNEPLVLLCTPAVDARFIERDALLSLKRKPPPMTRNGYTELRLATVDQLDKIVRQMKRDAWLYSTLC